MASASSIKALGAFMIGMGCINGGIALYMMRVRNQQRPKLLCTECTESSPPQSAVSAPRPRYALISRSSASVST